MMYITQHNDHSRSTKDIINFTKVYEFWNDKRNHGKAKLSST